MVKSIGGITFSILEKVFVMFALLLISLSLIIGFILIGLQNGLKRGYIILKELKMLLSGRKRITTPR